MSSTIINALAIIIGTLAGILLKSRLGGKLRDTVSIPTGLIAFTMSSIGVAVPVQGGIGPWHFMVIATLVCFGVNENDAAAFALVVHTVQTIWTGLCGLFAIVALPVNNRENS